MAYSSLAECMQDLKKHHLLKQVDEEVDAHLEMAEIQRQVYAAQGPALLFTRVKGCSFPCLANLYGTQARTHFIFRETLANVKSIIDLKRDPLSWAKGGAKNLMQAWKLPFAALHGLPQKVVRPKVMQAETTLQALPQIVSWPKDGGAYITLPQVYSEHPDFPGIRQSNLGMYRIQLSGGEYLPNQEVGLHYQIHRGLGGHHHAAIRRGEKLRVSIFVGGPPAHALAAVMPLPEGMPEIFFAGLLAGRRFRYGRSAGHFLSADADFCITGTIDPSRTKTEGPFGDHLGYYSLAHPFPVMEVEKVYHRTGAIWPFTVVGRPPQEDSHLAELIHEFAGPVLPVEIPGLHAVHAVEASGVHPLLLAIGSERYVPYGERKPRELLSLAHAVLGFGQLSLAKYLLMSAKEDNPDLNIRDVPAYFKHLLERVDWIEDLHFQTRTTMDTLDYSGTGLNAGSKVVIASAGPKRRELRTDLPSRWVEHLPKDFSAMAMVFPGIAVIEGKGKIQELIAAFEGMADSPHSNEAQIFQSLPLLILVDDAKFAAQKFDNFLWVTFTRSDPARDIYGLWAFTEDKHWGCRGSLIIDARIKPHHAPVLESDPEIEKRVQALASPGRSLHGIL